MADLEITEHASTSVGTIYLGHRPLEIEGEDASVTEIHIDGHLLMSSVDPVSERRLASSALACHRGTGPLRVLVGGLGLGYTAHAALADPRVEQVRVIEAMDFVIDWMHRGLFPLSETLTRDDRILVTEADVYAHVLSAPTEHFDIIAIDVDHDPEDVISPSSRPFYTMEGQRMVAQHLRPDGVLAVWSANDNEAFLDVLQAVYVRAQREHVVWDDLEQPDFPYQNVLFIAGGGIRG